MDELDPAKLSNELRDALGSEALIGTPLWKQYRMYKNTFR